MRKLPWRCGSRGAPSLARGALFTSSRWNTTSSTAAANSSSPTTTTSKSTAAATTSPHAIPRPPFTAATPSPTIPISTTITTTAATAVGPVAASGSQPSSGPSPAKGADVLQYPYKLVDTPAALDEAVAVLRGASAVALDVEAFCRSDLDRRDLGTISLVQASCDKAPVVYLFDVLTLTPTLFRDAVQPLAGDASIQKLLFDCRRDVEALRCQMDLQLAGVLDLQLLFTARQWRLRSVNRRSSMTHVLRRVTGMERPEGDSAVQAAMTYGNRPVWDVRPLPPHFLEYAASDVRHIMLLARHMLPSSSTADPQWAPLVDAVGRLTAQYVAHYGGTSAPVEVEADARPAEVSIAWLERYVGPGGVCALCGAKGHTDAECFRNQSGKLRCGYCGEAGHLSRNCFKRQPQMRKCSSCGQLGHTADSCFRKNPCEHCGGLHRSANCHHHLRHVKYFDTDGSPSLKTK